MLLGIHRNSAIVAISAFIWGLGEGLFIFFLPLALQRWNSDAVQIGAVLSMIGVTMAVVQVPAGYFSDRFGPRPVIFASLLLGIASAIVMAAARSLPFFVAGLLAYGCTSFIHRAHEQLCHQFTWWLDYTIRGYVPRPHTR